MNFGYIIANALKGQNHQHRATPCDWMTASFQALKGRHIPTQGFIPVELRGMCIIQVLKGRHITCTMPSFQDLDDIRTSHFPQG